MRLDSKLKNINVEQFKSDIYESAILNDVTGSVDELMNKYTAGLTTLLDIHAPLIHRVITPRPNAPWYTNKLCESKRLRRCFERKWRHSRTETDRLQYRKQCAIVGKELSEAKTLYLSTKVAQCVNDPKQLHRITDQTISEPTSTNVAK